MLLSGEARVPLVKGLKTTVFVSVHRSIVSECNHSSGRSEDFVGNDFITKCMKMTKNGKHFALLSLPGFSASSLAALFLPSILLT